MNIKTALEKYRIIGKHFDPDYERDNEALAEFKKNNNNLSAYQTDELISLLQNKSEIPDQYFVADLLYLYDNFSQELLEPLLETAVNHKDVSYNRIFLRPCLTVFGVKAVAESLTNRFNQADVLERIGVANLMYWFKQQDNGEATLLHQTIIEKANHTSNLVELYYYNLLYSRHIRNSHVIPRNAHDLLKVIRGNKEYEDILFNGRGWTRPKPSNKLLPKWLQKFFGD